MVLKVVCVVVWFVLLVFLIVWVIRFVLISRWRLNNFLVFLIDMVLIIVLWCGWNFMRFLVLSCLNVLWMGIWLILYVLVSVFCCRGLFVCSLFLRICLCSFVVRVLMMLVFWIGLEKCWGDLGKEEFDFCILWLFVCKRFSVLFWLV